MSKPSVEFQPTSLELDPVKLQVFDPTELVTNLYDFNTKGALQEGRTNIVRPVKFAVKEGLPIPELLGVVDEQLAELASYCGGFVVPHVWGIVKAPSDVQKSLPRGVHTSHQSFTPRWLPRDYILAARVEIIRIMGEPSNDQIQKGVTDYYGRRWLGDGARTLSDFQDEGLNFSIPRQISFGTTLSITEPSIIIHDIDPLLRL